MTNEHELSRTVESGENREGVTQPTRKGFEEKYVDLGPQLRRINAPHLMFLIIRSVNESQKLLKAYLLLVHEHDEGRCGPHRIPRSQLVSSTYLDINLDERDMARPHSSGFLFSNFFEGRFNEATRSTCGGRKEHNNSTV